jgi:WXG100 family type VII secretion target
LVNKTIYYDFVYKFRNGGIFVYSTSEINSTARRIYNEESELTKMENRMIADVVLITVWWKGNAGKAFIDDYNNQTRDVMKRLYAEIRDLRSDVEGLVREVQQADRQREIEANRKALLLQQQKSKK